jgi:hypothetical protein
MKLIYVRFRGLKAHSRFESYLVALPSELRVCQFKMLWSEESETVVYTPSRLLPLSEEANLYDQVQEFDTITVSSPWVIT